MLAMPRRHSMMIDVHSVDAEYSTHIVPQEPLSKKRRASLKEVKDHQYRSHSTS